MDHTPRLGDKPWATRPLINWCFSTLGCPDSSLEEAAELALAYGIHHLELRFLEGGLDLEKSIVARHGSLTEARRRLEYMGIHIASVDASTRLSDGKPEDFKQLESLALLARGLGAPLIRVFDGGPKKTLPTLALIEKAAENLNRFHRWRQGTDTPVSLMVETHDMLCTMGAVDLWAKRFGAARDLLWDSHHTWALGGVDPVGFYQKHGRRVRHIHLKDSLGLGADDRPRYTLFGEGVFPYGKLLDYLGADGYDGLVSVEWERKWHPELPPLETCLRSLRRSGYL